MTLEYIICILNDDSLDSDSMYHLLPNNYGLYLTTHCRVQVYTKLQVLGRRGYVWIIINRVSNTHIKKMHICILEEITICIVTAAS